MATSVKGTKTLIVPRTDPWEIFFAVNHSTLASWHHDNILHQPHLCNSRIGRKRVAGVRYFAKISPKPFYRHHLHPVLSLSTRTFVDGGRQFLYSDWNRRNGKALQEVRFSVC
ncbi:hypothetical protein CEXT_35511 [Caerostris extrusa]|uniref:Uncharacterized protein n=1 Tax=Caerostris extrusa TaxID=172846 RepID=A0AAV4UHG8_CAEEX|nr:hypothetical protein CEXT_35511 [Caerostris extrusa]